MNAPRTAIAALALLLAAAPAPRAQAPRAQVPRARDIQSDTWVGTDALGRAVPGAGQARPARKGRFVGIFYFLTHGSEAYYHGVPLPDYGTYGDDPRTLRDNTQVIRRAGGDPVTKPDAWKDGGTYWWGEPAVGHFLADDPWVARKNLRMLAEAGVDVIIFDVTNGPQYTAAYHNVLDTAERMCREGNPTPQFAFITYSSTGVVATQLYDQLYAKGLYKNLWFRWQGKPLMFGDPAGSAPIKTPPRPEVRDFFTWRFSWANTKGPHGDGRDEWEWADSESPPLFGWHDSPRVPEEVSVMAGGWSTSNLGRSFRGGEHTGGQEPPLDAQDVAADVNRGLFFSQQWRSALKIDPQFVFVTGWNEWTAGRQYAPGVPMLGRVTRPGQYYFVDNFNEEFSRDAMPMRGGYGDNYYMQLVDGIRRFKGVPPTPAAHGFRTLSPGGFAAWGGVGPEYRNMAGGNAHRDWDGWGGRHYVNATGRNDIVSARVACDKKNIYFYVRARAALSTHTDPNWMQLLLDTDRNPKTGWHGYDYVVNGRVINGGTTTLRRFSDGRTWPVKYRASGREMAIVVPRVLLGLTNLGRTTFDFHWIDDVRVGPGGEDLADWWYDGDSAPDGRFNYRYVNTRAGG